MSPKPETKKPKKAKLFLVYANTSPAGYFQVALVGAHNESEALEIVRAAAGATFVDAYGAWLPLYPDTELTAEAYDPEHGPIMAYSLPGVG